MQYVSLHSGDLNRLPTSCLSGNPSFEAYTQQCTPTWCNTCVCASSTSDVYLVRTEPTDTDSATSTSSISTSAAVNHLIIHPVMPSSRPVHTSADAQRPPVLSATYHQTVADKLDHQLEQHVHDILHHLHIRVDTPAVMRTIDNDACGICNGNMHTRNATLNGCLHQFCTSCILSWSRKASTCMFAVYTSHYLSWSLTYMLLTLNRPTMSFGVYSDTLDCTTR